MFAKLLILALAAAVNCQYPYGGTYGAGWGTYGMPVYKSSALYGGLYGANGWGYGANLNRVHGLGALRTTGAILGSGALGIGTGALVAGVPAMNYGYGLGHTYGHHGYYGHGLNIAKGISVHNAGPVTAAVHTISRTVDYKPVPYTGEPAVVQDIDVPPQEQPLRINFQSKSSPMVITSQHIPAEPGQVQVTHSEDEPQQAIHNVHRPVIQQLNEVIQPFRTLTQTVEPVIEQTHTNIAQGEGVKLTGLTSGVVGGTGVLAASGVGVVAPAIAKAVHPVGYGLGWNRGYGYGLGGVKTYGAGYGNYGYGLGLGHGYYGHGIGHGYYGGHGIGLTGLSGLSTYGHTAKVLRHY